MGAFVTAVLAMLAGALVTWWFLRTTARPTTFPGVADLLNWNLVAFPGVVLQKDGSFLVGFRYRGVDPTASPDVELNRIADRVGSALGPYTDDWLIDVDLYRQPAAGYAPAGAFPQPALTAIDEERRTAYGEGGGKWESECYMTVAYLPPVDSRGWIARIFSTGGTSGLDWEAEWDRFRRRIVDMEDRLQGILRMERLSSEELLEHLYRSLTGRRQPIIVPADGTAIDVILGHEPLVGDFAPRLGDTEIRVVGLQGYPPQVRPTILQALTELRMEYRWNSRIRPLSPEKAEPRLRQAMKFYYEKRRGAKSVAGQIARGHDDPGNPEWERMQEDGHAREMANAVTEAVALNSSARVRYCEFNSYLVLHRESEERVDEDVREFVRVLRDVGFTAQVETLHAMEAFLGTLPGHGEPNVQRPLLSTENIAALLPLASAWAGPVRNGCQYYPVNSPPLFWADTVGATPFRATLHWGDVGHAVVVGPTGEGKSTVLQHVAAQAFRYPDAQVFVIDKGRSFELLCRAAGGDHITLLPAPGSGGLRLQPFSRVDDPEERTWAIDWVEVLLSLQGVEVTPARRTAVDRVLSLLAASPVQERTLTDFVTLLTAADKEMGQALDLYTLTGAYGGILDGSEDVLSDGRFIVFETDGLLDLSEKISLPVLLVVLHRLQRRFRSSVPTYLIVDEAASSLGHPLMERKIKEYAVTLRKKNVALLLAFQDLHQMAELSSFETLLGSCPTRIFLPNPGAATGKDREIYERVRLNAKEIAAIAGAEGKRQYYFRSPAGARLFDLALGPAARALYFARPGLGTEGTIARARQMEADHGPCWVAHWLEEAHAAEAAAVVRTRYQDGENGEEDWTHAVQRDDANDAGADRDVRAAA